jgi:Flp pilus assembly protein TadG
MQTNGRFFKQRLKDLVPDQSGSIAVVAAICLAVILGFAALALDIGHLVSVKSELQKAADGGALAGARALNVPPPMPNWNNGQVVATATVQKNYADTVRISNCQVQTGYWDLSWSSSQKATANLKPTGTTPGPTDVAAVKVIVSKSADQNGGPVTMWIAGVFGIHVENLGAVAVATIIPGKPINTANPGSAFPLATPIWWVNQMWKETVNSDPFRIGSDYHYDDGGQWTSFLLDVNNAPTIRDLIDNGNPTPLHVGDNIWIEPGTKDTLFSYAQSKVNETVLLPIVADDYDTHAETPIISFVPFYIEAAVGADEKYIQGHFVPNYKDAGSTGGSDTPYYGAIGYNAKLVD